MLKETLGGVWLSPDLFRFGASTLLSNVLMQLVKWSTPATKRRLFRCNLCAAETNPATILTGTASVENGRLQTR